MTDFLLDSLVFSAKAVFVFFLFILCIAVFAAIFAKIVKNKSKNDEDDWKKQLVIENLSSSYAELRDQVSSQVLDEKSFAEMKKRQEEKAKTRNDSITPQSPKKRLFVLDFDGDIKASQAVSLGHEIDAVLSIAENSDEVVVKITSPGGAVAGYGLAASQLARLRDRGIKLTVCIDTVAASGGYMMACIANRIVAAPFAIVGSIGVVAEFPNFNKLLHRFDIDYEQETAGEFKRTLSMLGDNSDPKAREKFREQLEACYKLFRQHVGKYRPQLNLDEIATGEFWHGTDALKNHLVDEIGTSNEYILSRIDYMNVFAFRQKKKKSLRSKVLALSSMLYRLAGRMY